MLAVTGATGFIGRRLCLSLLAAGHDVRVLVRSEQKAEQLRSLNAEAIIGDLADDAALQTLVNGSQAVIHCAGTVRGRCLSDFYPGNVAAVSNLLSAAERASPTTRILFLSSLAAREPSLSHYANSKFLGEQAALQHQARIAFSIVRPPPVYGPGDKELLPLFQLMSRGFAILPGKPSDRISLLYVDDLVSAIQAWLALDEAPREIFPLCDSQAAGYSWEDLAATASQVFDKQVRLLQIPKWILDAFAAANQAASGLLGYAPMLTPAKVRELRHPDWCCNNEAFCAASGWRPQVSFARGLAMAMDSNSLHE